MKKYTFWSITMLLITITMFAINRKSSADGSVINNQIIKAQPASLAITSAEEMLEQYITETYSILGLTQSGLSMDVFKKAFIGYLNLKDGGKINPTKNILSIVDFTKSSRTKRLWIIDLAAQKLLFNTLVAHGQGSGNDMATSFSNLNNSHQSSLGFYITNEIYFGKHGLSLKMDGMDEGYNTNARERAVVVHGAAYVSQSAINQLGRLGRSHGCPALPSELTKPIIETIKNKTVLFINGSESKYSSAYLNPTGAAQNYAAQFAAPQSSI
ncbi:MAG TPA: murein L,D-transpeptidase catalytic domain family protein [Sphingobacteriaceae bacterium]|nr:murein L,D-transpeptidase catalytic domain family protein [Sphingobacteriaceae bacterium]